MDEKQAKALREPFPKATIGKLPKGGVMLDYVGHAATTDRLLQVDPTWTWEPMATDEHGLPALDRAGNLWIRLTVCGVTRIGVGDGKTAKEIIGDAIRNAAMRFGVALDLWAKEDLHAMERGQDEPQQAPQQPQQRRQPAKKAQPKQETGEAITRDQSSKMHALFNEYGLGKERRDDRLAFTAKVVGRDIHTSSDLTKREASTVIEALIYELDQGQMPEPPDMEDVPGTEQAGIS